MINKELFLIIKNCLKLNKLRKELIQFNKANAKKQQLLQFLRAKAIIKAIEKTLLNLGEPILYSPGFSLDTR